MVKLAPSATTYRAWRVSDDSIMVSATGAQPGGWDVDLVLSPLRIYPPQFNLTCRRQPGIVATGTYELALRTPYPPAVGWVTINSADGAARVDIDSRRTGR